MQISSKTHLFNKDKPQKGLLLLLLLFIIFAVFQDFLHSTFNQYHFYLSESLLFKSFWVLFLPFLLVQGHFLKIALNRLPKRKFWLILLAIAIPTLAHIMLFPFLVWLISTLCLDHSYAIAGTLNDTLAENLYQYILIYGAGAAFITYQANQLPIPSQPNQFLQKIVVGSGRNYMSIAVEEILFIDAAAPYIAIHTLQKTHLHHETLKAIAEKLNPKQFVRIHKSTIVNINEVVAYKSRLNGDYDLLLSNDTELRLSRNYAATFKSHQV